jgi:hypothetical protein
MARADQGHKYELLAQVRDFLGIDNVTPRDRAKEKKYRDDPGDYVYSATNVDIDDSKKIKRRGGYEKVVSATSSHSGWSNGKIGFFVDDGTLYMLNEDLSVTTMLANLSRGLRMSYVEVEANDRVYFTNSQVIGYVENAVCYSLPVPTQDLKSVLPPGKFIEYYAARLWVAQGRYLYFSDPLWTDAIDYRRNFIAFEEELTLLRAVDDGLYVGAGKTYFLHGATPKEMQRKDIFPYDAIPYTDIVTSKENIGEKGGVGKVVIWTSHKGICFGGSSGDAINVTEKRYTMMQAREGCATYIADPGHHRYVSVIYR